MLSKGQPRARPPCFDRFGSFGYDDLIAQQCSFRCPRLPDVDGIKMSDNDDQAAEH